MRHQRLWRGTLKATLLLKWKKNVSAPIPPYVRRSKLKRWWTTSSVAWWAILCSLVKEVYPWQLSSLVLTNQSHATRHRVCLFLPRPLISAQVPLSTPCPVIWDRATTFVLIHCYLTQTIHTIMYLALGMNHRSAKVSHRMVCWLYSPSNKRPFSILLFLLVGWDVLSARING